MTTRIHLVRHAAHDDLGRYLAGRTPFIGLGPAGRRQAEHLADVLRRDTIDLLQTSPVQRARETAEAVARQTGRAVEVVPALEEIDFGAWSGLSFDELNTDDHWRRWNVARSITTTPAGETMLDVQHRVFGHVLRMVAAHRGKSILMVSHADPIRAALAVLLALSLDKLASIEIQPASISTIAFDDWGAVILGINRLSPDEPGSLR
ncbi:MAG: phosphoglycerate mutase protein [Hyphomicrobiales bacterium]|nr:phosphoglycerate mutase protein [Hyphomicrobiales bacterium]